MRLPYSLIFLLLAYDSVLASKPAKRHYATHDYYVLEHSPLAGVSLAEAASALGVEVVEQAGQLVNHWLVRAEKPSLRKRDTDPVLDAFTSLQNHAKSQRSRSRREDALRSRDIASSIKVLLPQTPRQRVKRAPPPPVSDDAEQADSSQTIASRVGILDPEFGKQWHLVNDEYPNNMMNVSRLWEEGITGKGVISAVIDDGLDFESDDLAANFYAAGSYDFNDHEDLPVPKLSDDHHGTRCAGQIAAVKNDVCGVGVAYDSKIAGIRILSGPISDIDEASSLNYDYQNTSIFSCSWGPADDGRSMEAPGYLIKKAMVNGIQNGRNGKGSIFVFASGNGGRTADQCNFDGYTNSIFSVTVASVDFKGLHPDYSEACAANLVVAYSSGSGNYITSTDIGKNKCTHSHGGTSAAAPNAAGVFALALEARPDLSWRDIQHLAARTAQLINPEDPDWEIIAAGYHFSYKYGFGVLNGYEFVKAAQTWELVNPQTFIQLPAIQIADGTMDISQAWSGGEAIGPDGLSSTVTVSQDTLDTHNFGGLEHVTVTVWIAHTRRGDVEVELMSPNGVRSILASKRYGDAAKSGYPGWTFMSVKHWDEYAVGDWTIKVSDQVKEDQNGTFLGWSMSLFGSVADPSKPSRVYEVPLVEDVFPPESSEDDEDEDDTPTSTIPTSSKVLIKPTAHLPGDHGDTEGEASKPAFPGPTPVDDTETAPTTSTSAIPTVDEGWFSDMGKLLYSQVWVFVALGAVGLFALAAGIFFWRRAVRRRANYNTLPTDELPMTYPLNGSQQSTRRPRTKELYDAFGEVSDDDEVNEMTGLHHSPDASGYHSGFLDDDEPTTAGDATPHYKDDPSHAESHRVSSPASGSGSGDGSWEHASQTR